MKIFQIVNNIVHYDMTHLYSSAAVARTKYPATTQIVEAPDYVFEGWGFNPNENGEDRFIQPTPPEGWEYDETTGTFYNPNAVYEQEMAETSNLLAQSDYKIIKCYEYSLVGLELPYDINALHAERQALRDKINELEEKLRKSTEWPEWKQPAGTLDAYKLGAKVTWNGKKWTSDLNGNTNEPGVYGWTEVQNV